MASVIVGLGLFGLWVFCIGMLVGMRFGKWAATPGIHLRIIQEVFRPWSGRLAADLGRDPPWVWHRRGDDYDAAWKAFVALEEVARPSILARLSLRIRSLFSRASSRAARPVRSEEPTDGQ
jgi:hypothetical protein